jgi:hypothetical protein
MLARTISAASASRAPRARRTLAALSATVGRFGRAALVGVLATAGTAAIAAVWSPTAPLEGTAWAKHAQPSGYSYEQTWSSLLRLLRVDLGYKIVERDDKIGYVLFEYVGDDGPANGSVELLRSDERLEVSCSIAKYPGWHEVALLDKLTRKLRDDYGEPPERPRKEPDAGPAPDAGGSDAPSN